MLLESSQIHCTVHYYDLKHYPESYPTCVVYFRVLVSVKAGVVSKVVVRNMEATTVLILAVIPDFFLSCKCEYKTYSLNSELYTLRI